MRCVELDLERELLTEGTRGAVMRRLGPAVGDPRAGGSPGTRRFIFFRPQRYT
ncbi:MAG: hypothetical protein OXU20_36725 [Myxococcales bacterium]|nr:hypothetical protein [Myxococcales bacterium]